MTNNVVNISDFKKTSSSDYNKEKHIIANCLTEVTFPFMLDQFDKLKLDEENKLPILTINCVNLLKCCIKLYFDKYGNYTKLKENNDTVKDTVYDMIIEYITFLKEEEGKGNISI